MRRDIVDKDPLLSRLKIHADTFDAPDDTSGPDWPSPKVWIAVQEANKRRKKRRALWVMFAATAGMLGGMALWIQSYSLSPAQAHMITAGSAGKQTPIAAPVQATAPMSASTRARVSSPAFVNKVDDKQVGVVEPTGNTSPSEAGVFPKNTIEKGQTAKAFATPEPTTTNEAAGTAANIPAGTLSPLPGLPLSLSERRPDQPELHLAAARRIAGPGSAGTISLALQTGIFLTALKVKTTGNAPSGKEHAAWSVQYGGALSWQFSKHWSLNSGLQWSTHHITATRESSVLFKTNAERFDPLQQVYTGTVQQGIQTSFGEVEMRYDINRIAGQPVADQTPIQVAFKTDEKAHYLRLPLSLQFDALTKQKITWGIQGGVGINFLAGQQFVVYQSNANTALLPEIRSVDARNLAQARGLTHSLVDVQLGLSGQYRLAPGWKLQASLEGRRGLQSMYQNADFKSYPLAVGIQAGLFWQFTHNHAH